MRYSFGNEWRSLFSIVVFRGRKVRGVLLSVSSCTQCDDGVCLRLQVSRTLNVLKFLTLHNSTPHNHIMYIIYHLQLDGPPSPVCICNLARERQRFLLHPRRCGGATFLSDGGV